MKGHKAHEEHGENQEDVCIHFPFGLVGLPNCRPTLRPTYGPSSAVGLGAGVRSVQLLGDQSVAHNHSHQVAPENNLTDVIYHLVPVQPSLCLQVTALEIRRSRGLTGEDHIGRAENQQDGPDDSREEFATGQSGCVGPPKGLEGLPAAVDADEAEEEDADVHGEVEEH